MIIIILWLSLYKHETIRETEIEKRKGMKLREKTQRNWHYILLQDIGDEIFYCLGYYGG